MKTTIVLLISFCLSVCSGVYAQGRLDKGATFSIDSSLILVSQGETNWQIAGLTDINWQQIIEKESPEFLGKDNWGKYLAALYRGVKIYPDMAQKIIEIFKEVFIEEQIRKIANSYTKYGGKESISLGVTANPKGETIACNMFFMRDGPYAELLDSTYIKLYKLMMSRLKLNITDTGLKKYSYDVDVYMDDIINGTLTLKDYETD